MEMCNADGEMRLVDMDDARPREIVFCFFAFRLLFFLVSFRPVSRFNGGVSSEKRVWWPPTATTAAATTTTTKTTATTAATTTKFRQSDDAGRVRRVAKPTATSMSTSSSESDRLLGDLFRYYCHFFGNSNEIARREREKKNRNLNFFLSVSPSFAVFDLVFVVLIRFDWVLSDFRGFDEVPLICNEIDLVLSWSLTFFT